MERLNSADEWFLTAAGPLGGANVASDVRDFEEVLLEAIEEALELFGSSVKEVVLFYCQTRHGVAREELPRRLAELVKCLEEIFSYAAVIIEHQVASNLYSKLGLRFAPRRNWRLLDYVEEAKRLQGGGW